jgi:hypothetical protein
MQILEKLYGALQILDSDECVVQNTFNSDKMISYINKIYERGFDTDIRQAYAFKTSSSPIVEVRLKNLSGGALNLDTYFNVKDLLTEDIKSGMYLKCSFVQNDKCKFCEKWTKERIILKKIASKMIKKDDILEVLELMNLSVDYLPIAILNREDYHKFHIAIQEYKKSKNM